ncbi:phosphodiester glycosidase family protein [Paenibacillus chartarius]|uniref:Phosphodiester glycosidase family protein n=1 Tax=Paenibacillus chartarius TaxID=747481 RepID=A0ABV6DKX3_9BACL
MSHVPKKLRMRKRYFIAAICTVLVGGGLYKAADRYLIEHVEAVVVPDATSNASATSTVPAGAAPAANAAAASTAPTGGAATSATATGTPNGTAAAQTDTSVTSDDWNYHSSDVDIAVKKVVTGSGSNQITYYVADVKAADAAALQAAFAKNQFGRNITENTSEIAGDHGAVFAINGDYYGFRSDGVVIRNDQLYRNVPAREGVALYKDGTMSAYDELTESAQSLLDNGVLHTFSFGPALIKNGQLIQGFENTKIDTNFGNRTISGANPRTGIGMIAPNHYVFVVVDGRQSESRGMTLDEFAQLFADLGATEAYNLDGGGSSTMYFRGRVVNNPQGKQEERGVSDIIYIEGGNPA